MTIDTNELRRLAQAATPGPWYVTGKLTRYVEARIDGGLIQEVAACGPTKADGGYGPQQEANARLIAAANPATISELLDRLEAAEKGRDWHAERCEDAMNECEALRAKIEGVEDERMIDERRIADLMADLNRVGHENDALRAKIADMEKRAPFDADSDVFRSAFEATLKAGNWPATRQGDGYRSPSTQIAWRIAFSTVNRLKLCLAPSAQPAPNVPEFCPCCGNIMRACMSCPNEDCNAVTATAEQSKYNKQPAFARKASGAAVPEAKP